MEENNLKYCKIEAQGFQDLCNKVKELEEKNARLEARNYFLERKEVLLIGNLRKVGHANKVLSDKVTIMSGELRYYQERTADLEEKLYPSAADLEEVTESELEKAIASYFGDDE
jgi:hypothetical protein